MCLRPSVKWRQIMANSDLFVRVDWEEVKPDGSKCCGCGDACYLFMSQAYYQVDGQRKQFIEEAVLCRSCDEIMRESPDAGEEWKNVVN